ncbi:MAG: hypothetical protein SGI73_17540 [Chloroflexota bacterium]|nr:hypothetical protein [Chloroflexota bacterium]
MRWEKSSRARAPIAPPTPRPHPVCARALDALNAFDALNEIGRAHWSPRLCGGARIYGGDMPRAWAGVVMWARPSGYLGYKVLTVVGVWARTASNDTATDAVDILIGAKRLAFARPFFDPEPYHHLFARDYTLYYNDDGSPPADPHYQAAYDPAVRLAQRDAVTAALGAQFDAFQARAV